MITSALNVSWPVWVVVLIAVIAGPALVAQHSEIKSLKARVDLSRTIGQEEARLADAKAEGAKVAAEAKATLAALDVTKKTLAAKRAELDKLTRKVIVAKVAKMDAPELSKAFEAKGYPNRVVPKAAQ